MPLSTTINKIKILILIQLLAVSCIYANRIEIPFNENWKFHLGHTYDISQDFGYGTGAQLQFAKLEPAPYGGHGISATLQDFDDKAWKSVTLPHDWTVGLPYDFKQDHMMGNRYGYKVVGREYPKTSIGWYRKKFDVDNADDGKQLRLEFDGVFRDCMVWVNGFYIGRNWSGYTGFEFDVSDYLIYGKENIVTVRVDATLHEGWFYEGSGINKEVKLVKTNLTHLAHTGPQITTTIYDSETAEVALKTEIVNEDFVKRNLQIIHEIRSQNNQVITVDKTKIFEIEAQTNVSKDITLTVKQPQLWHTDSPYRYRLITKVLENGELIDSYEQRFGIRTFKFDTNNGFLLNGERLQIKGVCGHQNFAVVGSGLPESLHYYRLNMLKGMGANAIRSHYALSKTMLNACDSLGILVMEEVRVVGSTPEALKQLRWMITQHRNHPSIFLWSMGNEEGGVQRNIIGKRLMKKMVAETHRLDPTRLTTAGVNAWGSKVDFGFSQEIDVMGFNYSLEFIDDYHKNHPNQPIIGTEVSNALSTRDVFSTTEDNDAVAVSDGIGGYYLPEKNKQKEQARNHLPTNVLTSNKTAYESFKFYAERPYLAGSFLWTGFDYYGETWPSPAPNNSSQFGCIDLAGFPKSMYYYYKAWWQEEPVLHIAQHWNYKGLEGEKIQVLVHTNCDEVKLILNKKNISKISVPQYGYALWQVPFQTGTLMAVGYKNGKEVVRKQIETTTTAYQLSLNTTRNVLSSTGEDVVVVSVEVKDKKGRTLPLADNLLSFKIEGDAQILGCGNGDPASKEISTLPSRKAFAGKAIVVLRGGKQGGVFKLKVQSVGLKSDEMIFTIK